MSVTDKINGKYITLSSVGLTDAEFIVSIRNDVNLNTYVHKVSNDVEKQREWIRKQIATCGDYYFVVKDCDDNSIGLASIYNVDSLGKSAEFGRWVSRGNAIQNVESVLLSHDFAFEKLGMYSIYTRTMVENEKVKSFWKNFGAECVGDVYEMDLWLSKSMVTKEHYYNLIRPKITKLLRYGN